jgi:hypothetical protein
MILRLNAEERIRYLKMNVHVGSRNRAMPLDQHHEKEKHEEKSLSQILNNFDSWHNAYEILQKFNRYPTSKRITKDYLFLILLKVVIKTTITSI